MEANNGKKKHFVLVHGICHGAWSWYKVIPHLKSSGHRVTAVDLGGCGSNPDRTVQVTTVSDYLQPLMEVMASLPPQEKVVLVGHSFSGLCISLAMEKFPGKISVAVFVAAYMPNHNSPPATFIHEFFKRNTAEKFMDCEFSFERGPEKPPTTAMFGPNYMQAKVYRHCQPEDLELARMLVRPSGLFVEELGEEGLLTAGKFGSVSRVFLVCKEDGVMEEDFQWWMIHNNTCSEITQVISIHKAGHMVMLSKPTELSLLLRQIADKYD